MKQKITFEEYLELESKLDIQLGQVVEAERVPKSKKLLQLKVTFGGEETKTVVTNIGDKFEPEVLSGLILPFVMNLVPVTMMGITSEAMIVVGTSPNGEFELTDYSIGTKLI